MTVLTGRFKSDTVSALTEGGGVEGAGLKIQTVFNRRSGRQKQGAIASGRVGRHSTEHGSDLCDICHRGLDGQNP